MLVALRLLPHVVILHALPNRARPYLTGGRNVTAAGKAAQLKSTGGVLKSHLIGLNEVEVFAVNSIAMLKVPALFLTPSTQI